MQKTTLISEMQKFRFGCKVFCSDGEDGILTHVSFDAASRGMAHIGVKQGRIFGRTVYVPYDTVTDASSDGVNLRISRGDLAAASRHEPGDALLDGKSVVQHADTGIKGTLTLVAVHPESGTLAYLVAHNLRRGQDVLIQREYVAKFEKGLVMVSIPEAVLQTLSPYRPDDELQQEVEDILFDLTPLHVDFAGMKVRVLDSVLYLDGNISSSLRGDIVQDQAAGVRGLLEIKNNLVGDDKLASDLAAELAKDPRTRDLPIGVYPRLGVVRLSGAVHTDEQKAAAAEIARNVPGVRTVVNDLAVDPKAALLRVMATAEPGDAPDRVPGKYIRHTK